MKRTLLIAFLASLSFSAHAGCKLSLAEQAAISSQITATLKNQVNVEAANAARWWRNESVPAEVEKAQNTLARLEENLLHDDRLAEAVHQTRSHMEAVEVAFRLIKDHVQPMRKIFHDLAKELSSKSSKNLEPQEIAHLEEGFLGIGDAYAPTSSYPLLSRQRKAVGTVRLLEEMFSKRGDKPIDRAKIIQFVEGLENWMKSQEDAFAYQIGKHLTTYEMLKSYLESSYEDRHIAYSVRTESIDQIVSPSAFALESTTPDTVAIESNANISATRKAKWEQNVKRLKTRVGWNDDMGQRFPGMEDSPVPTLSEIRAYYNQSNSARLAHNRGAAYQEIWTSTITQLVDLSLVGAVVRPLMSQVLSGPGKLRRALNALKEWSLKAKKSLILKDIQELVESSEDIPNKASNLANYAGNPRTGQYFLELFASYSDLNARIVWREIREHCKKEGSYYPDLAKMMDTADLAAEKSGVPVSIQTSYWSPSQTAAVLVWVVGIGYYQFYGDEDEELDNRVRNAFWSEIKDFFGMGPDLEPSQEVINENGLEVPAPQVKPDTLDEIGDNAREETPQAAAATPEPVPAQPAPEATPAAPEPEPAAAPLLNPVPAQ
ncbi:MAG: hypothetical protein R3A80_10535 [Bdellovibrionota bacterium]